MKYLFLSVIVTTVLIFSACSKNSSGGSGGGGGIVGTVSCTGVTATFAANALPAIQATCQLGSNCHSSGSTNSGGPFTTYAQIFAKKSNIKAQLEAGSMPQSGSISLAQKQAIICWIDSGAPNN